MNDRGPGSGKAIRPFVIDDFRVTYAGDCPPSGGFCFGSEDGKLLITSDELDDRRILPRTTPSGEPVNGVAFVADVIGVSTRADVAFLTAKKGRRAGFRSVFDGGAHAVQATASGNFIAPLGMQGLLQVKPESGPHQSVIVSRVASLPLNFYRAISIARGSYEILACAARDGGVVSTTSGHVSDTLRRISTITFPGLDVVDVCSISANAVAAVARNSTLILLRDVLLERAPVTVKFNEIVGSTYRVFHSGGNLFLLTSTGLYALLGLARRFMQGEDVLARSTAVRGVRVEAVDANLCRDRWILVVSTGGVLRIDVEMLVGEPPDEEALKPQSITTTWEAKEVEEERACFEMAGA